MCVLFTSARPLERAENIKAVYDAYDGDKRYIQNRPGAFIPEFHSGRYKVMVSDELMNVSTGKYIFIGHGMGACKTYGLDMPHPYFHRPDLLTYLIASSEYMVPIVAKQSGVSREQVIPLGMPRTDAYFRLKKKESPYKHHLYAPTFRWGEWLPDLNKIQRLMPENNRLTVKMHMVTGDIIKSVWPDIDVASSMVPSTPYLVQADTVITDYSSIMFDAMVLRKPVILFARDKGQYLDSRGMYFPYPEQYSRYYSDTEEDLVELMETATWDEYSEHLRQFYCGACDGHSTERVVELIRSCL